MESARIFLLLSFFFLGGLLYVAVTRDLSPMILAGVGFLGLASLFMGILIGRENPNGLVHLLLVIFATVAIFATVFWWYSKVPAAAVVALMTAPPALVFAGLSLRRQANRRE
jgi:hypothetical protein